MEKFIASQTEVKESDIFSDLDKFEDEFDSGNAVIKMAQNSHFLSGTKLAEIRAYTANEIFKARKKTDSLYSEFSQVKKMKEAVKKMKIDMELNENKVEHDKTQAMFNQLDSQFHILRKTMLQVQARHDILKRMKSTLLKLVNEVGLERNKESEQMERQLLKDYKSVQEQHGQQTRQKATNELNLSMLTDMSSCSSESMFTTPADSFYKRWSGFLYRDDYATDLYMNSRATWMLPQGERDSNLQQVNRLKKELSGLHNMLPASHRREGQFTKASENNCYQQVNAQKQVWKAVHSGMRDLQFQLHN